VRLAVAAYLARFKGQSRIHTESDLRGYLAWCELHGLDPLSARRPHIELYLRWLQEVRRYRPSTVSRRMSVVAGFYRTCVTTVCSSTPRPSTCGGRMCRLSPRPSG
jgi:integrase/recombinase XerD